VDGNTWYNSGQTSGLVTIGDAQNQTFTISSLAQDGITHGTYTVECYRLKTLGQTASVVSFDNATPTGLENIGTDNILVDCSPLPTGDQSVVVGYQVTGGSAQQGVDYNLTSGTMTFSATQTSNVIPIQLIDNQIPTQADRTIQLSLYVISGNATIGNSAVYTIKDNDLYSISFIAATGSDYASNTNPTILAQITPAPSSPVTVNYLISGGSAVGGGVDYTFTNGTLTFDATHATVNVPMTVINNSSTTDKTVSITLANPSSGAVLGSNIMFTYTIKANSTLPVSTNSMISFNVGLGSGPMSVQNPPIYASIDPHPATGEITTVSYAATGGTAIGSGVDFTLDEGTLTFDANHSTVAIPLSIVDHSAFDVPEKTIEITMSILNTNSGTSLTSRNKYIYTIDANQLVVPVVYVDGTNGVDDDNHNGSSWLLQEKRYNLD